jgi:hypothetical protein
VAANGDLVQETHYPTVGFPPAGIAISRDGSRAFVEEANYLTGTNNALTLAYDSAGNQLWVARYPTSCPDLFCSTRPWYYGPITVSPDGSSVFVTGSYLHILNEEAFVTLAYDATTGVEKWEAMYPHNVADTITGPTIEANPNGKEVYVTGAANSADTTTLAYDPATGNQNWVGIHAGGGPEVIAVSSDGSQVFVAGSVLAANNPPATDSDLFTLAYNTTTPPLGPTPVQLTGVVSRKVHGSAGTFDITLPLTGTRGVECRSSGPNGDYTLIFTFSNPLTTVAGATTSCGSISSNAIGPNQNQYTVNLTGENSCDGSYVTVTLQYVVDSAGNISSSVLSPQMGLLIGDVNATGLVDGNDVSAVQAHTRQTANSTNFRADVNATGSIDGNDVSLTQSKTRTSLPSPP